MTTGSIPKKVAIAGAGPGGLEVALAADHAADAESVASGRAARRA